MLQSSTWSNYKQHNTVTCRYTLYIVVITPNGAISFISPVLVCSISNPELTRCSGLLTILDGKGKVSVMVDREFTIRDQVERVGVELNILLFLDDQNQQQKLKQGDWLPHYVSTCWTCYSCIGRKKNFTILNGVFPLNLAWVANEIVSVWAWLINFFTSCSTTYWWRTMHQQMMTHHQILRVT